MKQLDVSIKRSMAQLAEVSSTTMGKTKAADALAAEPEDLLLGRCDGILAWYLNFWLITLCETSIITELEFRVSEKRQRLGQIQATTIDEEERDTLIEEHNHYLSLWKKRKRSCLDAIDMISEGMEKPKSFVMVRSITLQLQLFHIWYIFVSLI